ncbi:MAG: sensor histidine kinase, partial [Syntrophobacteraceae bacterium]
FAERLNERGIKWAAPETSVEFAADRLSIIRVLTNLVENALKYGGSMLSEIRIGYQATEKHHILSVSDDGVGIHREDCEKIFGLFQRNSTSKGIPGTGLGLSIVRETAERHHGKVWVEPAPDHGSIFYISIAKDF